MIIKKIVKFFDKTEDRIRAKLSRYPILYAFIGGTGMVLFWRGIWYTADSLNIGGTMSLVLGAIILLLTGVFVYNFVGNTVIISGIIGKKKISEKEESEIHAEELEIQNLQTTLNRVEKKLENIEKEMESK